MGSSNKLVIVGIVLSLVIGASLTSVTTVPAGHVGVVTTFGKVDNTLLDPGLHFINPLSRVTEMSIRTQELKEAADVPSKEGLGVHLEVSVLYRLIGFGGEMEGWNAARVFQTIGPTYQDTVLTPLLRSEIRAVTVNHEAKALYTSGRELIQTQILDALKPQFSARGVVLEAVLLRSIKLPEQVQKAVDAKLAAEQDAQKMEWVIAKERKEADRKTIEAEGIANYQRIIAKEVSAAILRWKGIEATEKLASSANAKVVVIGSGKDGLPIILGGAQ